MDHLMQMVLLMLEGTEVTLEIFVVTFILVLPLGLFAALGRLSSLRLLNRALELYIWIMRGTPLMLQLLFVYFALPMVGIKLPDIAAALLAFTLNYTAYFAEIFRAGIQAVPKGQYEAAHMLGLSKVQTMWRVVIPQMIRNVLPHQPRQGYVAHLHPRDERPAARRAHDCPARVRHDAVRRRRCILPRDDGRADLGVPSPRGALRPLCDVMGGLPDGGNGHDRCCFCR